MESIDLSKISNLEHRAVIKAVLESELPFVEIQKKLNVSKSNFYWIIRKYLPANFLEERKQHEQLKKLSSLVGKNEISSSDQDKVGILALPSSADLQQSSQEIQESTICNSQIYWEKPRHKKFYDILDSYMAEDPSRQFPQTRHFARIVCDITGTNPSYSDLVLVGRKWRESHPEHPSLKNLKTKFKTSLNNRKTVPNIQNEINIEIGQIKISWSSNSDDVESAIVKVISELKDLVIKQDIKE